MIDTVADRRTVPDFPDLPPALTSSRRKMWHRCVLCGIGSLRRFGVANRDTSGIVTYHRVADNVGPDPAMLNVTPKRFRRQIEGLIGLGYQPVALSSLIERHRNLQSFSSRMFAIVFDDGYNDLFRNAWPILQELNAPATIFIATGYLDSHIRFPFDDWSRDAATTARPLSTGECLEMLDSGLVELGSHTHSHRDFRGHAVEFRADLQQSLDVMRERFGIERPTFSFPYGFTTPELVNEARALSVSCGLTADCELIRSSDDPMNWGRFGAIEFDTQWTLAGKLDGWYSTCQNAWRCLRRRHGSNLHSNAK